MLSSSSALGDHHNTREYRIKAAFLFNFLKFIEFPDANSPRLEGSALICLSVNLGHEQSFASVDGRKTSDFSVNFKYFRNPDDTDNCQVIFLDEEDTAWEEELKQKAADGHILLVGEREGFAEETGMINFYLASNKVKFEINKGRADKAGIRISSNLLKLARIVGGDE
ncbi:YfiR family protein [Limisalsivibrio acetivorans]|uniref:YfiR family protein n=1 Tax=Limisalsivibrio acetivorans TaxID=1304888 RepID=UPI0003B6F9E3|nr:YfiR family protein [Limisalsivibrio acetivorans]